MRTARWLVPACLAVALLMFVRAPYLINAAPPEIQLGVVQKIFYFHVPSAITAMLSAIVSGIASAFYLRKRSGLSDHVALAAAELVVVFGAIVLILGGISYVKDRDKTDLGIATVTTERRGFVPPWVGGVALLAGVVLLFAGRRSGTGTPTL